MKVKIFHNRNPQKVEEQINEFSKTHEGKCPMAVCLDSDGMMTFTGFYWYDEPMEKPEPIICQTQIDMSKWKHDTPDNYWTKDKDTGVERRAGLKGEKWWFCEAKNGTKTWFDVVKMDIKTHTIIVKPRQ